MADPNHRKATLYIAHRTARSMIGYLYDRIYDTVGCVSVTL